MMVMSKIDDDYVDNQALMTGMGVGKLSTLFMDMGHGFHDDGDIDDDMMMMLMMVVTMMMMKAILIVIMMLTRLTIGPSLCHVHHSLLLPGEMNILQIQCKIYFNTFLLRKPHSWCIT